MAASLFGAKNLMRHVLTLKGAMYNSWAVYSKKMKLSFKEASFSGPTLTTIPKVIWRANPEKIHSERRRIDYECRKK